MQNYQHTTSIQKHQYSKQSARSQELEERVAKMEEEYKTRMVKLEAKEPVTPLEQCEAKLAELKAFSATIVFRLEVTQKLLKDTTSAWDAIEEIDDLVKFCATL